MVVVCCGCLDRRQKWRRRPMQPASAGSAVWGRIPTLQSELQAAFARGIGQRLDAAVVAVTGTVECDLLDAGGLGLLGDRATDLDGGLRVLAVLQALAHVGLGGAGRRKDLRAVRAEQLRV